jgi:CheY-like chemotaxis protein
MKTEPVMSDTQNRNVTKTARRWHILHAEDVSVVALRVARFLTAKGYVIETVASGAAALALTTARPGYYDLVITDHAMPELTGLEFITALRQTDPFVKIVVFAATLTATAENQYKQVGVNRILCKSDSLVLLSETVEELLRVPNTAPAKSVEAGVTLGRGRNKIAR